MNDNKQELPFRLQITDNRTGEVLTDENVSCIIGGMGAINGKGCFINSSCTIDVLAKVAACTIMAIQKITDEHSEMKALIPFYMALNKKRNE